jgi:hypothetical protein
LTSRLEGSPTTTVPLGGAAAASAELPERGFDIGTKLRLLAQDREAALEIAVGPKPRGMLDHYLGDSEVTREMPALQCRPGFAIS